MWPLPGPVQTCSRGDPTPHHTETPALPDINQICSLGLHHTHVQIYFLGPHHARIPTTRDQLESGWLAFNWDAFLSIQSLTFLSHRSCERYYCDRFSTMPYTWVAVYLLHRGISGRPPKPYTFLHPNQKLRKNNSVISAQKFSKFSNQIRLNILRFDLEHFFQLMIWSPQSTHPTHPKNWNFSWRTELFFWKVTPPSWNLDFWNFSHCGYYAVSSYSKVLWHWSGNCQLFAKLRLLLSNFLRSMKSE